MLRLSEQLLHGRFFSPRRGLSEAEIDFLINVDFVKKPHGNNAIIGAVRWAVGRRGPARERAVHPPIWINETYQGEVLDG